MKKFFVFPYKAASSSAKLLAQALEGKRIKLDGSRYRPKRSDVVINWGNSRCPFRALNADTAIATNKLETFKALKAAEVSVPEFGETSGWAIQKLAQGKTVFARTRLDGHSGQGIVEFKDGDDVPEAPLYVEYVPKKKEFRVHVVDERVIYVTEKRRKNGAVANKVRSHDNGYVFATQDVNPEKPVFDEAIKAVKALNLDFGAVDVIWNIKRNKAYVLEVNTAPGLCNTTAQKYAAAFKGE